MICQQCKKAGNLEKNYIEYYYIPSMFTTDPKIELWHKTKALHASCVAVDCYCQHRVKKPN